MQNRLYLQNPLQSIELIGNINGNNIYSHLGELKRPTIIIEGIPTYKTSRHITEFEQLKKAYLLLTSLTESHLFFTLINRTIYKTIYYAVSRPTIKTYRGLRQKVKHELKTEVDSLYRLIEHTFFAKFDHIYLALLGLMYHSLQDFYGKLDKTIRKELKNNPQKKIYASDIVRYLINRLEKFLLDVIPLQKDKSNSSADTIDEALKSLQDVMASYTSATKEAYRIIVDEPITDTYIRLAVQFKLQDGRRLVYPFTLDFLSERSAAELLKSNMHQLYHLLAFNEGAAKLSSNPTEYEKFVIKDIGRAVYDTVDDSELRDIYTYYYATDEIIKDILESLKTNVADNQQWNLELLDDRLSDIESLQDYCYFYPATTYLAEELKEYGLQSTVVGDFIAKLLTKFLYYSTALKLKQHYIVGTDNLQSLFEFAIENGIKLPILIDYDNIHNTEYTNMQFLSALFVLLQNILTERNVGLATRTAIYRDGGKQINSENKTDDVTIKMLNEMWLKSLQADTNKQQTLNIDDKYKAAAKILRYFGEFRLITKVLRAFKESTSSNRIWYKFFNILQFTSIYIIGTASNLATLNISENLQQRLEVMKFYAPEIDYNPMYDIANLIAEFSYNFRADIFSPLLVNELINLLTADERLYFLILYAREVADTLGLVSQPDFIVASRLTTHVQKTLDKLKSVYEEVYLRAPNIAIMSLNIQSESSSNTFESQSATYNFRRFLSVFKYFYLALGKLITDEDRGQFKPLQKLLDTVFQQYSIDVDKQYITKLLYGLASELDTYGSNTSSEQRFARVLRNYIGYLSLAEKLKHYNVTNRLAEFLDKTVFSYGYDFITQAAINLTTLLFILLDLKVVLDDEGLTRLLTAIYAYYFYPSDWLQRITNDKSDNLDVAYKMARATVNAIDVTLEQALKTNYGLNILLSQLINPYYFAIPFSF